MPVVILCFSIDSLIWKCLPSYIFSLQIIISRLKIRNFFTFSYWTNFYRLLIVFTDVTERMIWFLCEYLVNFFIPNCNSKIGFMTQHLCAWKFSCPIQIPSALVSGINNDQFIIWATTGIANELRWRDTVGQCWWNIAWHKGKQTCCLKQNHKWLLTHNIF